jgi:hypothetical protein
MHNCLIVFARQPSPEESKVDEGMFSMQSFSLETPVSSDTLTASSVTSWLLETFPSSVFSRDVRSYSEEMFQL